jgi:uncharacterized protein (TIRG00374 family)
LRRAARLTVRALQAAAALALLGAVIWVAGPRRIVELIGSTDLKLVGVAAGAFGCTAVLRGLRLLLLLPRHTLRLDRATLVAVAAQAASQVVPARLGELALPLLLGRVCRLDLVSGAATLLAARALDMAALGAWTVAACAAASATHPAVWTAGALLLAAPLLLPWLTGGLDRIAAHWSSRAGAARRWAERVHRLHAAVVELGASRIRLALAGASSLAMWGGVWVLTWFLLAAMGHRWPPLTVAAGSAVASITNILPVNLVANLGTLEAGWTAAFSTLGVPLETAAATGLAAHLWSLLLTVAFGACAWVLLHWLTANNAGSTHPADRGTAESDPSL